MTVRKPELNEIIEIVNSFSEDVKVSEKEAEKSLVDLGIDSLVFVSFIVELEERFDFEFPDYLLTFNELDSVRKIFETMNSLYDA